MGLDKSLLSAGRKPMIAHIADQLRFFPELLIGANDISKYAFLGLPVIPDQEVGKGPLMGLVSCVERAAHDVCFVTGCDIPTIDPEFVLSLLDHAPEHDVVMPRAPDGWLQPLLAVYRKTVVPIAKSILTHGDRPIVDVLAHLRVRYVPVDSLGWYWNLNTMDDYTRWLGETATTAT